MSITIFFTVIVFQKSEKMDICDGYLLNISFYHTIVESII